VTRPARFDVGLTENLFGDMLSAEAPGSAGTIGLLRAARRATGPGLYEPVHGSAPDIAGRDVANPLGTIASLALLFSHSLNLPDEAAAVEQAIEATLTAGDRTADLLGASPPLGCRAMGARVASRV
jgi:3-isopropylmalate dehydrogenase